MLEALRDVRVRSGCSPTSACGSPSTYVRHDTLAQPHRVLHTKRKAGSRALMLQPELRSEERSFAAQPGCKQPLLRPETCMNMPAFP